MWGMCNVYLRNNLKYQCRLRLFRVGCKICDFKKILMKIFYVKQEILGFYIFYVFIEKQGNLVFLLIVFFILVVIQY